MSFTIPIISGLFELGKTWLEGFQKKQSAKDERAAELIRQAGSWEEIHAQGAATSWKDEWITILWSVPLIMCFIPSCVDEAREGFAALSEVAPEWYILGWSVIVAASFGVRTFIGKMKK